MWVFYTRRGKGDARGISYLEEGAIQGFENPIRILGFLKKKSPLVGVRRGLIWVFAPEGARGMPEVSSTKTGGQSKVLKPPL